MFDLVRKDIIFWVGE